MFGGLNVLEPLKCEACGADIAEGQSLCHACGQKNTAGTSLDARAVGEAPEGGGILPPSDGLARQIHPSDLTHTGKNGGIWHIFSGIFSVILAVLIFAGAVCASGVYVVRAAVSPEAVSDFIRGLDISAARPDRATRLRLAGGAAAALSVNAAYDELLKSGLPTGAGEIFEAIGGILGDENLKKYNITRGSVEALLENPEVKEFIAQKAGDYVEDLLEDNGAGKITPEEIVDVIRQNGDMLERATGYRLTEEDYSSIRKAIGESGVLDKLTAGAIEAALSENAGVDLALFRRIFSYNVIYACLGACAAALLLLLLLNRKNWWRAFAYVGAALALAGTFFAAGGLLFKMIVGFFVKADAGAALIADLTYGLRSAMLISGLCVFFSGGIFIALFYLLKAADKKHSVLLRAA